jgi:hypothetical protein
MQHDTKQIMLAIISKTQKAAIAIKHTAGTLCIPAALPQLQITHKFSMQDFTNGDSMYPYPFPPLNATASSAFTCVVCCCGCTENFGL